MGLLSLFTFADIWGIVLVLPGAGYTKAALHEYFIQYLEIQV